MCFASCTIGMMKLTVLMFCVAAAAAAAVQPDFEPNVDDMEGILIYMESFS